MSIKFTKRTTTSATRPSGLGYAWSRSPRSRLMVAELVLRAMTRPELDLLVDWAADEGWNPGTNDAQIFWDTDPEGFVAAELRGELIGGGSIVSYAGRYGFMGFFIVRPEHR